MEIEIWSNISDDYEIGRLTRFYPKHANPVRPSLSQQPTSTFVREECVRVRRRVPAPVRLGSGTRDEWKSRTQLLSVGFPVPFSNLTGAALLQILCVGAARVLDGKLFRAS